MFSFNLDEAEETVSNEVLKLKKRDISSSRKFMDGKTTPKDYISTEDTYIEFVSDCKIGEDREDPEYEGNLKDLADYYNPVYYNHFTTLRLYRITGEDTPVRHVAYKTEESGDSGLEHFTKAEKEQLAISMQPFIINCAIERTPPKSAGAGYDYDDVLSACYEGFTRALNRYNKLKISVAFSNYAYSAMNFAVIDMIRKTEKNGRKKVTVLSLSAPAGDSDNKKTIEDTLSCEEVTDKGYENAESSIVKKDFLAKALKTLNDEEMFLVKNYFMSDNRMTQMEIAQMMGVSQTTVRNKINKVLGKLKETAKALGYTSIHDF